MKKEILVIGAVAIAMIVLSSTTAVSQVNGETIIEAIESEEQYPSFSSTTNDLNINSLDDILELIDIEGFETHFTSENFADFLKSDEIQNIIAGDLFLNIYNSQVIQDFIQSDTFIDFFNSNEVQTFLSNYNDDNGQGLQIVVSTNEELLPSSTLVNLLPVGYDETTNTNLVVINELGDEPSLLGLIFMAFVGLIVGLLTWIPIALIYLVEGVIAGSLDAIYVLIDGILEGGPNPFAYAASIFVLIVILNIGLAAIWPLWTAFGLAWLYWDGQIPLSITEEQTSLIQEQVFGSSSVTVASR